MSTSIDNVDIIIINNSSISAQQVEIKNWESIDNGNLIKNIDTDILSKLQLSEYESKFVINNNKRNSNITPKKKKRKRK